MFHGTTNNIFHDIKQFFNSNFSHVVSDCTIFVQYFPRTVSKAFVGIFINVHAFNIHFTAVEARILSCLQVVQVLRPLLVAVPPWSKTVMERFTASRKMSKISYLYKASFHCLVGSYLMINIGGF